MKTYGYILTGLSVLALSLTSCDDKESPKTQLPEVGGAELTATTYESLSFSWNPVKDAQQYGAFLFTADGLAAGAQTSQETTAVFSELDPDTEYVLKVYAYAFIDSDQTTSKPVELTAKTNPLTVLDAPVIGNETRYDYVFTWDWDSLADEYEFSLKCNGELVESTNLTPDSYTNPNGSYASGVYTYTIGSDALEEGEYTLSIKALTTEPGYADSPVTTLDFHGGLHVAYIAEGTYSSKVTGTSWPCTLTAYSDLTYTLSDWYGVEGYDLSFGIEGSLASNGFNIDSSSFKILNDVTPDAEGFYPIPTGLPTPETILINPTNNSSKTIVWQRTKVFVKLYVKNPATNKWVQDQFTGVYPWNE